MNKLGIMDNLTMDNWEIEHVTYNEIKKCAKAFYIISSYR